MNHASDRHKALVRELAINKEKLKISQSLIKIGFWELNLKSDNILLSDEALSILESKNHKNLISFDEFAAFAIDKEQDTIKEMLIQLAKRQADLDIEFALKKGTSEGEKTVNAIAKSKLESKYMPNTIIGIVKDISEQRNSEKVLKKAKEKAEEADFLKSAFLANMSHEIRTPLNAILGFSRLLTNPNLDNSQRKEYSEYITSSANNLLNLIRDIVDVSKIEADKIIIEKNKCQINKILDELKFTFEKEKENQKKTHIDIVLNTAIKGDDFMIFTDSFRFHQILVNLIGNALKFIEKGYIEFGYVINNKSFLQFYVKDTGIGIPDDKIDLIFSRFGQIIDNKIKNPGGTGLGLSITKYLVERLGGKIWVESEQGYGTTFYFTLPYEQIEDPDYKQFDISNAFEEFEIKNLNILAVEDDPINMVLLEDTLMLYIPDIQISKASNGIEALKILEKKDFDLILMDIRMPQMDGYTATEKIRKDFTKPKNQTPILGLSAHALKNEIEKGKILGMNDFLSKPIQVEELIQKIKKLTSVNQVNIADNTTSVEQEYQKYNTIDLSFFIKLFKNNQEKIQNTLKEYLKQVPTQLKYMEKCFNNGEKEKLKTLAHSLKSTFKYIGRLELSEKAREIEISAMSPEFEELIISSINILNEEWKKIEKEVLQSILK